MRKPIIDWQLNRSTIELERLPAPFHPEDRRNPIVRQSDMDARKNYLVTFFWGVGGILTSSIISFISAPISLNYWKVERYGLWALLYSVMQYLIIANFGVGQAATILIGKNIKYKSKIIILRRSATILFLSIAFVILVIVILHFHNVDWVTLLGRIPEHLKNEGRTAGIFIVLFFFINLPFTLVTSMLNGCQKAYIENFFLLLTSIANLVGLIFVISLRLTLKHLAIVNGFIALGLNLVKLILTYFVLRKEVSDFVKDDVESNRDLAYSTILKTSVRCFLVWLAATLVYNTDNFIVSNMMGLKEVMPYSITYRLYSISHTFIFTFIGSMAPLMARAFGANDWEWIDRNYGRFMTLASFLGGLIFIGGLAFCHDLILLWVGPKAFAGVGVLLALGAYSYLLSMTNLNFNIINSFNYTKGIWLVSYLEGFIKISLSVALAKVWGLAGIAAGTAFGSLLGPTWIYMMVIHRRSKKMIHIPLRGIAKHFSYCVLPVIICLILIQSSFSTPLPRILGGFIFTVAYCALSYVIWPKKVKNDIQERFREIIQRIIGGIKKSLIA